MFKNKYFGERYRIPSCLGSPIKIERGPKLDKHGNVDIVEKGKIDFQAYINSWRDDCDINLLVAKYTNGDKTALIQRAGMFADISDMPVSFNEIMNLTMQAESVFDSLPVEAKEAFGNNVNNFLSNAGSGEWKELLSKSPDDFRKEKIRRSNGYTKENKESYSKSKYPDNGVVVENPAVEVENKSSLVDEVSKVLGGKLNEQK